MHYSKDKKPSTNLQFTYCAMNKRQQTVLSQLRPKVKAFGFSKNVLKSIAAYIADKLEVDEDASDEDVNAKIVEATRQKLTDTRRSRLEKLLKGTSSFGDSKLRDFRRMKFETDEDFDEFFSDVEEDLKILNQERANAGLDKLGVPASGNIPRKKEEKQEVLSEDEIKE